MIRELKFKILCRKHSNDIYRFSRSILGNSADAEDATQEILLKLWQNVAEISTTWARGWIMKTTRNHCLNIIHQRSRATIVQSGKDGNLESVADKNNRDAESVYHGNELRSRIDHALNRLPENLRSVFVLYEVNGLKYREIAESLEIPVNSVKVYVSRSRARLREILAQEVES